MKKKGSRAQGSHVVWETADQLKKGIVGSRGRKTAEKTRAQSPKSNFRNDRKSRGFKRGKPLTNKKKESRAHPTGGHVVWKEKPLTRLKIRAWAQGEVKPRRKWG